ncbi:MAG: cupin domain-containing protein [Gammaproteobacteria bacterium]
MTTKKNSANDAGVFEPFGTGEVPWEDYAHGERFGIRFKQVGEYGGGSHVGVCIEILEPGKQTCPEHYHMLEEEHVMILDGALTLRLGAREYPMRAGDYVCFPAGQRVGHTLINQGDAPCRYLIVGERNPNEVVVYPQSGRVSVRLTGAGYRGSATMDYWEGVEP